MANLRLLPLFLALGLPSATALHSQTDTQQYPPLGRLIDVGGYSIHLFCIGSGGPTVLITGSGFSFDWGLVQPEVASFTQVCTYDRAGTAWSDPGPRPTCSQRASEIGALVGNAGIGGPYVLVGHSLGAVVSRIYASQNPEDVAGMVIVDHAISFGPEQEDALPSDAPAPPPLTAPFSKLPARDYELHQWATSLPTFPAAFQMNMEVSSACDSEAASTINEQKAALSNKPLIVVSADVKNSPGPFNTAAKLAAYERLQTDLLALSTRSLRIVAENSTHYVTLDRPDVVIEAIRRVVREARESAKE